MVQKRGHMLALSYSVSQLLVTETHNHEMVQSCVTLPFLFCRNHSIRVMSRVWHQPSQLGKAYNWFQCRIYLGSSETVSNPPWCYYSNTLLRLWDSAKNDFLLPDFLFATTVVTLPFLVTEVFFILPHFRLFLLVLWVYCCFQISVLVSKGLK